MKTFAEANELLGNRSKRKLENNTYVERINADCIAVRLHKTYIVIYYRGFVMLSSGGYQTHTIKDRINKYSPCSVYQQNGSWYLNVAADDPMRPARWYWEEGIIFNELGHFQVNESSRMPIPLYNGDLWKAKKVDSIDKTDEIMRDLRVLLGS